MAVVIIDGRLGSVFLGSQRATSQVRLAWMESKRRLQATLQIPQEFHGTKPRCSDSNSLKEHKTCFGHLFLLLMCAPNPLFGKT